MKKIILLIALFLCVACITFTSCTDKGNTGDVNDTETEEENESYFDASNDAVADDIYSDITPEEIG